METGAELTTEQLEQLATYVRTLRSQGVSDDEIFETLAKEGWTAPHLDKVRQATPTPSDVPPAPAPTQPSAGNTWAVASFVLGLCVVLTLGLSGPFAVWTGIRSKRQRESSGLATAGVVLGIVGCCLIPVIVLSQFQEASKQPPPAGRGASGAPASESPALAGRAASEAPPADLAPPAARPQTWTQVASWSGNGVKTTPKFTVGDEWAIEWATQPGQYGDMNFQIYTYAGDGSLSGVDANIVGTGKDKSYKHRAGTYYLEVNSGQPWQIKIWDNR